MTYRLDGSCAGAPDSTRDSRPLTLVTGFWPPRNEVIRKTDVYVRLFDELLRHINGALPLAVLADPRVSARLRLVIERAINEGYAQESNVILRELPFEELHFAHGRERFDELEPCANSFGQQTTIDYAIVMWSKPALVAAIAEEDPFESTHFGWIDLGIAHVAELRDVDWAAIAREACSTDRVRICERYASTAAEAEDPYYFYSTNSSRNCGGFFTGTEKAISELAEMFDVEVARMTDTGSYVVDEQILAAASALHPSRFDKWYGDYFGLLRNACYIERDVSLVLTNLHHCREEELWNDGVAITEKLLASAKDRRLRLEPEECLKLLDDGLACAIENDRELALSLARTIVSLYHHSRLGRGMMKGMWRKSIRENLLRLELDFKDRPWTWEEFTARPDLHTWLSCF